MKLGVFPKGTRWKAQRVLGQMGVLDVVMPRRFRAYCCGLGKTGTHSIADIFANYRSGHESDDEYFLPRVLAYYSRSITAADFQRELRNRDWKLWLEMDSWNLHGQISAELLDAFPQAMFILTIREPYSWADSYMNHDLNRTTAKTRQSPWRNFFWRLDEFDYTRFDGPVEKRNLYPLEAYFFRWAFHNKQVLDTVPKDQLLVVRTPELQDRIPDLAAFLNLPAQTLAAGAAWSFSTTQKHGVLAAFDPAYVSDLGEKYTKDLVARFFPDLTTYGKS